METIGTRLRLRRKELNITQADLANEVGTTVAYISMLENGKANPSIGLLKRISDVLSLPVAAFFAEPGDVARPAPPDAGVQADAPPRVVTPATRKILVDPTRGAVRWELLTPDLQGALEFMLVTYAPYAGNDEFMSHEGEEAGLVLSGTLEITFADGQSTRLQAGDSVRFPSHRPHRIRNPGGDESRVVWVITPPSW